MYLGVALSAFRYYQEPWTTKTIVVTSGSKGTPSISILSKCVPASQLGKIFSISQAISTLFGVGMGYLSTQVSHHHLFHSYHVIGYKHGWSEVSEVSDVTKEAEVILPQPQQT